MICPITGAPASSTTCASCMSYLGGACRHRDTVNVEGDLAAVTALYGVTSKSVESRCQRIKKGVTAASFFEYVTRREIEDARPCDFVLAKDSEDAYKKWPARNKMDWAEMQHQLDLLHNLLTSYFQKAFNDQSPRDSSATP